MIYTYPYHGIFSKCKCHSNINQGNGKYCVYNDRPDLPQVLVGWFFIKDGKNSRIFLPVPANTKECYGIGGDVYAIHVSHRFSEESIKDCNIYTKGALYGDYSVSQILNYGDCEDVPLWYSSLGEKR